MALEATKKSARTFTEWSADLGSLVQASPFLQQPAQKSPQKPPPSTTGTAAELANLDNARVTTRAYVRKSLSNSWQTRSPEASPPFCHHLACTVFFCEKSCLHGHCYLCQQQCAQCHAMTLLPLSAAVSCHDAATSVGMTLLPL